MMTSPLILILHVKSNAREGTDDAEPHARYVDEELDASELLDRCDDELAVVVVEED